MAHDLSRFVDAQAHAYDGALRELRAGRKTGHWIWYVFPQLTGLGMSDLSRYYAIRSLDEARAYLDHPVLGPRLRACAEALLAVEDAPAEAILGPVDAMKVRSSVTLFHRADPLDPLFPAVLDRFYGGAPDPRTDELLGRSPAG
jgi:uncharacterized protein (DUF1810 family)